MLGLLQIFYSPAKVFDRVRERGTWFPALLGIMVCALLASFVVVQSVGMETLIRKQIESNPRQAAQMGPEGIARAANSPIAKGMAYGAPLIATPIVMIIIATLFMTGLTLSGSKLRFSQVLGATSYAWFPYSVLTLLMTALILQVSPNKEDLNFRNLIATNAGAFLDPATTNKGLYSFASSIDLLSFGLVAFLAYGLSRVSQRSYGSCLMVVAVLWLVYVIGKTGIAAI